MNILFTLRNFHRQGLAILFFTGLLAAPLVAAPITGFDDIDYWVGSGANRAALVIDWNDGIVPVSLAWGFRWDGVATGMDMLKAIAGATLGDVTATGADARLSVTLKSYGFGDVVDRIVFDGGGYTHDSAGFESGGYWEYNVYGGNFDYEIYGGPPDYEYLGIGTYDVAGSSTYPVAWESGNIGAGDRELADGYWDGWSFAPDFVNQSIDVPLAASIPEPGALLLLTLAGGLLVLRRRSRVVS